MGLAISRSELQAAAQAKLDDALLLLKSGRFSNAYYLAGYAVELGLKACIARQIAGETIPDSSLLKGVLSHEFDKLVGLAGLKSELQTAQDKDSKFATFWGLVSEWTPDSRYEATEVTSSQLMIAAVGNPASGVLQWIKNFW